VGEHSQLFQRSTRYLRNGYASPGISDCNGIIFGDTAGGIHPVNEKEGLGGEQITQVDMLNTGNVGENCGSTYRGEDFKMIRVTVGWSDALGSHPPVIRHMYLSGY